MKQKEKLVSVTQKDWIEETGGKDESVIYARYSFDNQRKERIEASLWEYMECAERNDIINFRDFY